MKVIDKEALLNAKIPLPTEEEFSTDNLLDFLCGMEWVGKYVKEMPTMELIQCAECYWYRENTDGFLDCFNPYGIDFPKPEDFCSYSKPKEET